MANQHTTKLRALLRFHRREFDPKASGRDVVEAGAEFDVPKAKADRLVRLAYAARVGDAPAPTEAE